MEKKEANVNFSVSSTLWVIFAVVILFMFKTEIKELITRAETIKIAGVEIRVSQVEACMIKSKADEYEKMAEDLSEQVVQQELRISSLLELSEQLGRNTSNTTMTRNTIDSMNKEFRELSHINSELKLKANSAKEVKILSTSK